MSVGSQSQILKASDSLKACLAEVGKKEHFAVADILFREDGENAGVFLVVKGRVSLSVRNMPQLDRVFGAGSLLGLPSSFTGRPYSLTAEAVTDADVVQVTQADFVQLMREQSDLCREATEILGREVTFIQSALAERRRQTASSRISGGEVAVV
jgi:CRP-like cAMP-binding protein